MKSAWMMLAFVACDAHTVPEHVDEEQVKQEVAAESVKNDPSRYLTGGERVFFDDFERAELGPKWQLHRIDKEPEPSWRIENGWVRNDNARNQGMWAEAIPEGTVRVEVVMKSLPPTKGRFKGDMKFEAFATDPEHEKGYSFINGGWDNQFDTIAKRGEHSADEKRVGAMKLVADKAYKYAAVRTKSKLYWFRDGELLYTFDDGAPIQGKWVGLNNWESNAAFGEVAVYKLAD